MYNFQNRVARWDNRQFSTICTCKPKLRKHSWYLSGYVIHSWGQWYSESVWQQCCLQNGWCGRGALKSNWVRLPLAKMRMENTLQQKSWRSKYLYANSSGKIRKWAVACASFWSGWKVLPQRTKQKALGSHSFKGTIGADPWSQNCSDPKHVLSTCPVQGESKIMIDKYPCIDKLKAKFPQVWGRVRQSVDCHFCPWDHMGVSNQPCSWLSTLAPDVPHVLFKAPYKPARKMSYI